MSQQDPPRARQPLRLLALSRANRDMVGKLVVIAGLMFGFGYAMVPMYKHICAALGINVLSLSEQQVPGAAGSAKANTQVDLSRTITVEFDANARGPWDFKAETRSIRVHPGEITTVMYEFRKQATSHFNKLECFCFSEHTLKPGESKRWPVVFVIDSKLPKDVSTITLSYTFFEVGGKVPAVPGGSV
jgi:cytochrome c oxidase assembly protein subunit 11